MKRLCFALMACLLPAAVLVAQDVPAEPPSQAATPTPGGGRGGAAATQEPQPYEKVITRDAKSTKGVFTVHQIKEKYFYEIPKTELGKDFLWNTQIAKTTLGVGYGGNQLTDHVVRWELVGNKVNLRGVDYSVVADPKKPIATAVKAANNDAIIRTFPVAAFAPDGAPVIEVTQFFTADVQEFSARQALGATAVDATRSYIERISAYPENIEAEATITYTRAATPAGAPPAPAPAGAGAQMRPGSASVVLHHSMVKLPENPMTPRVFDERVGYFSIRQMDYGKEEHRAPHVQYITRWRLEKKDPGAALSEPVKPIVYYVDPATPKQWIPWVKKAIEDWQPAFEAAGFKNAIVAKEAPATEEDPEWSCEDVRHSVVRWLPSTTENAVGPNIHDPRTGEILNADIQLYHNVMNLVTDWYFVQVGHLDPRAQKLPLPEELMGRLIEYVIAHEVGHTLGFQHNMKASSMYPQDKIRDPEWVKKMGHTPSIMDYARFNYVAQPEDKIAIDDLIPRIGPYDIWAAKWGYTPIAGTKAPDDEKPTLDQWAREQDATPWLRFSSSKSNGSDPGELTEAVGDADAIKSTALGLKNLQRTVKLLIPATAHKDGEPYDDLDEMYGRVLSQWTLEMNHVAAIVGGFLTREKYVGQAGAIFTPVSRARQMEAVQFINDNAFATPAWALDRDVLGRIEVTGALSRVRSAQSSVMTNLLSGPRFARLVEQEASGGATAYGPADFLAAVRKGIWKELDAPQVRIDAYRRNLQRAYLDLANTKINSTAAASATASGDERPFYRAELRDLDGAVTAAEAKTTDRETKAHLAGVHDQIAKIMDPKFAQTAASGTPVVVNRAVDMLTGLDGDFGCWPDYIIRP